MSRIESIATALPPNVLPQEVAREGAALLFAGDPRLPKLLNVFDRCGVETRHFVHTPDYYLAGKSFDERNDDYIEQATALAARAAEACLDHAGVGPDGVDHLVVVTTTGLATPSLDALFVPRLGLRPQTRRWPLFGLGCAGGAGALIRADEILRGHPDHRALVISVELCGQVFSPRAKEPVDAVGAALFGDGAVAVLVGGVEAAERGPKILATGGTLFDDSRHIMGWHFTSEGLRLVLSQDVTSLIRDRFRPVLQDFLRTNGLALNDIVHWALHPGGRRILEAYHEALGCSEDDLLWSRQSLARVGNLSSASVLFVLADIIRGGRSRAGEKGVVAAPGPGFGVEMLVLEW